LFIFYLFYFSEFRGLTRHYSFIFDDLCSGDECVIPNAQDVQRSLATTGVSNADAKSTPASSLPHCPSRLNQVDDLGASPAILHRYRHPLLEVRNYRYPPLKSPSSLLAQSVPAIKINKKALYAQDLVVHKVRPQFLWG